MIATPWLVALACAQFGGMVVDKPAVPAKSKITAVTVYQGQALVTREVAVPEGEGSVEVVVSPLPAQAIDNSLFAEGTDGVRVLSTRFRVRAVKEDTREEVRVREDLIKKLQTDAQRLQKEAAVQEQDLQYLAKLEGFTGSALNSLTEKGRLDSDAVIAISRFVMENRGEKSKASTTLKEQLQANADATELAQRQRAELSTGSAHVERDAVIIVHKLKREAGTIHLGYLVNNASWSPQYRLRGTAEGADVKLEYLASVTQLSGEPWTDVSVTLSNARPSLDAAPPDLLPLKMAIAHAADIGPIDAKDDKSRHILSALEKPVTMSFPNETPLEDVIKYVKSNTIGPGFESGIPIYIDPIGLQEAEKSLTSPVTLDLVGVPLRTTLALVLDQLGLKYTVKDGLLKITSANSDDATENRVEFSPDISGAGMGGMGRLAENAPIPGGAMLNREAAHDQAEELRVAEGPEAAANVVEKDSPSVAFKVDGRIDVPSRRDPQLLEVARIELPAEYYAKAVPVLTSRIYRLAKLTNKSDIVLLPGDANVYVGTNFVGRMRMPLVAAGEPFVAGFGVDPQVQVVRRLMRKARTVQGGNQVFTYEFRIGLRNYHPAPVKVQLWDRLPRAEGEAVVINLVKTSNELSTDPMYLRTSRMDNLLRWDIDVPTGAVGEKTLYLNYEFRLEYSRDLPQPKFLSGGLKEAPIGGGAMMGGMGGMGGFM